MLKQITAVMLLVTLLLQIPAPAAAAGGYAWGARIGRAILELIGAHDIARQHREQEAKKAREAARTQAQKPRKEPKAKPAGAPRQTASKKQAPEPPRVIHLVPTAPPWWPLLPVPVIVGELLRQLGAGPGPAQAR